MCTVDENSSVTRVQFLSSLIAFTLKVIVSLATTSNESLDIFLLDIISHFNELMKLNDKGDQDEMWRQHQNMINAVTEMNSTIDLSTILTSLANNNY